MQEMKRLVKLKPLLIPFVYLVIAVFYYLPGFTGKIIWGHDTSKITFPFSFLLDESLKNGNFQMWVPDIFFGYPLGSEQGQFGIFYLPNLIHAVLPLTTALTTLATLHFTLAGFFTYLFCRQWRLSKWASLFAGLAYMLNGAVVAHAQYPSHVYAYTYLPLVLWAIEMGIRQGKSKFYLLAGAFLGFQMLTGHPNTPVITLIASYAYLILRFILAKRPVFKPLLLITSTFFLVSLPFSAQLITLIPLSVRAQGVDFVDATNSSLTGYDFITFLFPNFFFENIKDSWGWATTWHTNGYWGQIEATGYVGVTTLILALISGFKRKKLFYIILILLIISLMVALGKNTPFYENIFFKLPLLQGLRAPAKFLLLTDFCLAILAAIGLDNFLNSTYQQRKKYLVVPIIFLGLILLGVLWISNSLMQDPRTISNYLFAHYPQYAYQNAILLASGLGNSVRTHTPIGLIILIFSTVAVVFGITKIRLAVVAGLLSIILLADLLLFAKGVNQWIPLNNLYHKDNPDIQFLETNSYNTTRRVYTFTNFWSDLLPDQLVPHHIPEGNGFVSLPLTRYNRWQKLGESEWQKGNSTIFETGSIGYVYSQNTQPVLTKLDNSFPRAYITASWNSVPNSEEAFAFLSQSKSDLKNSPVIEKLNSSGGQTHGGITPAVINKYSPEYVEIEAASDNGGILVLTDTNYPGWQAYVDGKGTEIYTVNYLFRGIVIPAGKHIITFSYKPVLIKEAFIISLITLAFSIGYVAIGAVKPNLHAKAN